jgi:hypothetical protein
VVALALSFMPRMRCAMAEDLAIFFADLALADAAA